MASYVSVADAQTYFDTRLNVEAWEDATLLDQTKSLAMATRVINNLNFSGEKTSSTQDNAFPRGEDATTPQAVLDACCEIALSLLDGIEPDLEFENLRVVTQNYATVKTTYDSTIAAEHLKVGVTSIIAWRLLLPFLRDSNTINLSRVS